MGITIHAAIEERQIPTTDYTPDWHTVADLVTWEGLSDLASALSGARDRMPPLYEAREIPVDSRAEISTDPYILKIMHSRSWLTLAECREVYAYFQSKNGGRDYHFEGVMAFMQLLEDSPDKYQTRFVFAFDD